jgi:hypothetical protein
LARTARSSTLSGTSCAAHSRRTRGDPVFVQNCQPEARTSRGGRVLRPACRSLLRRPPLRETQLRQRRSERRAGGRHHKPRLSHRPHRQLLARWPLGPSWAVRTGRGYGLGGVGEFVVAGHLRQEPVEWLGAAVVLHNAASGRLAGAARAGDRIRLTALLTGPSTSAARRGHPAREEGRARCERTLPLLPCEVGCERRQDRRQRRRLGAAPVGVGADGGAECCSWLTT